MTEADITPFLFEGQSLVLVIGGNDDPWFALSDVCAALDIVNTARAAARLDADEKGVHSMNTPGGRQDVTIINELGLYSLILTSRKPAARRFKKWVTGTVLPTIRRTGSFSMLPANDCKAELAVRRLRLHERNAAVRQVEQIKRHFGAQAARDSLPGIYASVGVPVDLRRAMFQPELNLQQPAANDDKGRGTGTV